MTLPKTMTAVLATELSGERIAQLTTLPVPVPTPGSGEVLIKVAAAGVNRGDLAQVAGMYPPPPGAPQTLGLEVSGTIVDGGGMAAPDTVEWPWTDLTVEDFKPDADPNGLQFPHATLTTDQVAALGLKGFEGGFFGTPLKGSDGKPYILALRPILPDDPDN